MTEGSGGRVDRITRSAVNFGDHGTANYHEAPPAAGADETTVALLEAVRTLRDHLRLLTETDDTTGLDGELAVVQGRSRERARRTRRGSAGCGCVWTPPPRPWRGWRRRRPWCR